MNIGKMYRNVGRKAIA